MIMIDDYMPNVNLHIFYNANVTVKKLSVSRLKNIWLTNAFYKL